MQKIQNNLQSKLLGRVKRLENGNYKYIEIIKNNFPKKLT